jgi:hypothetical protein
MSQGPAGAPNAGAGAAIGHSPGEPRVPLFHVATTAYADGEPVSVPAGDVTHFHRRLACAGRSIAEERLEKYRLRGMPSRRATRYAFDDPNHCALYGQSEYRGHKLYYYRVAMPQPVRAPMALVDAIGKIEGVTEAQVEQIVREYWSPTRAWSFWEYLDTAMTIIEQIPAPDTSALEFMGAQGSWDTDFDLARRFARYVETGNSGWLVTPGRGDDSDDE